MAAGATKAKKSEYAYMVTLTTWLLREEIAGRMNMDLFAVREQDRVQGLGLGT